MVIIQLPASGEADDFDRLIEMEDALVQGFSQNGYAVVDGHDYGSGTASIFLRPRVGMDHVVEVAKAYVKHHQFLDRAVNATHAANGKHAVVWPVGFDGEFIC